MKQTDGKDKKGKNDFDERKVYKWMFILLFVFLCILMILHDHYFSSPTDR